MHDSIEIIAPVGSFESLAAAIQAGADAVYFGVEQLNMRARSTDNFSANDMAAVVQTCKPRNTKTYLTLNSVLYDHDMQLMRNLIRAARNSGVDAVIASDYAVLLEAKMVGMPVHISTQANVSNVETVAFFAAFADVIVLARELSLSQVGNIVREIKRRKITGPSGDLVRIEVFAHGALCMAISGKCYLSLHSHFSSANRGACVQNCRRQYVVTDKEEGFTYEIDNEYIMSAKDLCIIDFLDQIVVSGVQVLKVEGRGRSAEYVYTTTRCYKEAVNAISNGTYTSAKIAGWKEELKKVYNRGFWDGYYLGRKLGEWTNEYGSSATERKVYVGKGSRYFPRIGIGEFLVETGSVRKGDELMIISSSQGISKYKADQLMVNGVLSDEGTKGDKITFPVTEKITDKDKLYKLVAV